MAILLNPGKAFPVLHLGAELGRAHISGGKLPVLGARG
jgi:glycolate oxidase